MRLNPCLYPFPRPYIYVEFTRGAIGAALIRHEMAKSPRKQFTVKYIVDDYILIPPE